MRRVENCIQQLIGNCCRLSSIRLYREWIFCCCYFNWKPTKIGYNPLFLYPLHFAIHFGFQSYITNRKTYVCYYSQWAFYLDTTASATTAAVDEQKIIWQDKRVAFSLSHNACGCWSKLYESNVEKKKVWES